MTWNFDREYQRLKETGKIDGLIGAKHVGMLIDFHNKQLEAKKEKSFKNDIHDRNKYYIKLVLDTLRKKFEKGEKKPLYKSNSILL